jgi:hypothetical protein
VFHFEQVLLHDRLDGVFVGQRLLHEQQSVPDDSNESEYREDVCDESFESRDDLLRDCRLLSGNVSYDRRYF